MIGAGQPMESGPSSIHLVWRHNLEDAFAQIADLIEDYQYISVETVFPGIVARPITNSQYSYQSVKVNVDLLNVIQLALTFANGRGEIRGTWQFTFCFALSKDLHSQETVDIIAQSGLNFSQSESEGIDARHFGELVCSSGIVMSEEVRWISFDGFYDFGFLLKILTGGPLPATSEQFKDLLTDYFPCVYDLKYLLQFVSTDNAIKPEWTLRKLCDYLGICRPARQGVAGPTSMAIAEAFFALVSSQFDNRIDDSRFSGALSGLIDQGSAEPTVPAPQMSIHVPWDSYNATHHEPILKTTRPAAHSGSPPEAERLPPGMLRLRPSQISTFASRCDTPQPAG